MPTQYRYFINIIFDNIVNCCIHQNNPQDIKHLTNLINFLFFQLLGLSPINYLQLPSLGTPLFFAARFGKVLRFQTYFSSLLDCISLIDSSDIYRENFYLWKIILNTEDSFNAFISVYLFSLFIYYFLNNTINCCIIVSKTRLD